MANSDGAPWSTPAFRLRYDVFLSFRGTDTRGNFTQNLYTELVRNGIRVFLDDDGLKRGDSLDPTLFEAIEDSAASITIISPNYASSRWCLEEVTKICECRRLILPVFYLVNPSDVSRQSGDFEAHFRKHESRYGEEMVLNWRKALRIVGGITGWVYKNSEEHHLIRSLVKRILNELSNTPVHVASYTVGLTSRVEKMMSYLDVKCRGIQVLGIYGMGGIGKTTLAKALYNKLVSHFVHRSFISNVRDNSLKQNGLLSLQNQLISDLTQGRVPPVNDDISGKQVIKRTLREKQVLVVLDDLNDLSQLNALGIRREWFSDGSLIIISTRDREVLPTHLVDKIYEMEILDSSDSLKLFSYHALGREKPTKTFQDLAVQIVSLTGGLPLALEVFGSSLFDKRRVVDWEDALKKLKDIRDPKLQDVLQISYDGLDEQEKCMFLDIACILLNQQMTRDYVIDVMKGCGFRGETGISVLISRSLVKVLNGNTLWMHDQIRDMGRQIVLYENFLDPGMRSRLWIHDEILRTLEDRKGTRNVQGITLASAKKSKAVTRARTLSMVLSLAYLKEMYKKYFQHRVDENEGLILNTKQFELMANLRLLQFIDVRLEGNFKHLPAELKWLQWKECPLKYGPSGFPRELTVLDLSESKIERVWDRRRWSFYDDKVAEKLIVLNLRKCSDLTTIPDLSGNLALEKLILEGCRRLTMIHKSIMDLHTLRLLDLRDCNNLVEFPSDVSGLKHLENLILSGCSKLKELPQDIGSMSSLRELLIDETAIKKLPDSMFRLRKLERLSVRKCHSLRQLPECIGKLDSLSELYLDNSALVELPYTIGLLTNLEILSLMWCESLTLLPNSVGDIKSLTKVWLTGSSVEELPASVGSILYLRHLSIGQCHRICTLPSSIEGLASMVELELDGTSIIDLPEQIGAMKSLRKLHMRNCSSLRSLPETIGALLALETLIIVNAAIVELPETLGMLQHLKVLKLNKCKLLCRLPVSIGSLESLHDLQLDETALTEIPENFGMLSNLTILKMAKTPYQVPQSTEERKEIRPKFITIPSSFSKLSSLKEFNACAFKISGKVPDDFENLTSLVTLNLSHNNICSLPSSLRGLSLLQNLRLSNCKQLKVLPQLPSSLKKLIAMDCIALERMSDLSNLENLEDLFLTNCEKLMDIPGLECLKSLKNLHFGGCDLCSSVMKGKLDKVALKKLQYASMPGSEIPDWFTQDTVCFSKRKNYELIAVLIGVVISVNQQTLDQLTQANLRHERCIIVDIQAKILRQNKLRFQTSIPISGVPKIHEDLFYLSRLHDYTPLLLSLEDGDKIQIAMCDPPFTKGVELKKWGIHLVFENDDDYDGDEKSLDESQQSVSEKLTRFMGASDENSANDVSNHEIESKMLKRERTEDNFCRLNAFTCVPLCILGLILVILCLFLHFSNAGSLNFSSKCNVYSGGWCPANLKHQDMPQ